jgi:hypothetical protein
MELLRPYLRLRLEMVLLRLRFMGPAGGLLATFMVGLEPKWQLGNRGAQCLSELKGFDGHAGGRNGDIDVRKCRWTGGGGSLPASAVATGAYPD